MSSAYWNQWDRSEIDSMHNLDTQIDEDSCLYLHKEDQEGLEEDREVVTYNFTTWEAI